jgi:hypothetical protein
MDGLDRKINISGRKKSLNSSPCGKIASPLSSDFLKIFSDDFLYRQIVHGKAGGVREAYFLRVCNTSHKGGSIPPCCVFRVHARPPNKNSFFSGGLRG